MELQSGTDIAMGPRMLTSDTRDNRSVPEWIEESILPKARDDRKPLLDIYAETLGIHDEIMRLRGETNALDQHMMIRFDAIERALREIRLAMPVARISWYKRILNWFNSRTLEHP